MKGTMGIKAGINIWAFPEAWTLAEILDLTRAAGFAAIELDYGPGRPLHAGSTAQDAAALLAQCRRRDLAVSSLASGVFWQVNLLSDDAAVRAEAKTHVRHMMRLGAALGVRTLLIVPGFVGPFEAGAPVIADYEATLERALEDFAALAAEAADYDVVLAIETVWNKFLTSPLEMRTFVDGVDSASGLDVSHMGVYLDVANVLRTGYPEHWIRVLGSRIQGVHFKDFAVGVGNLRGFVDLLRGDVDFGAVMAALRASGYQGYGVVEMAPDPRTAAHRIRQAAQDMAYILKL